MNLPLKLYTSFFIKPSEAKIRSYDFKEKPGLYIHIPFCRHFCDFCPYHKLPYDKELALEYPELLLKEYSLHKKNKYTSLYIGGGTPSDDLDLLEKVIGIVEGDIEGEVALEVHPRDTAPEKLERMAGLGVNYVSLGIQSLDDRVLRHFGRTGNFVSNIEAIEAVMNKDFDFVDIDLVFDPVEFGEDVITNDLTKVLEYLPDQVSVYPMMRFFDTKFRETENALKRELKIFNRLDGLAFENGYERKTLWTYSRKNENKRYSSVGREFYLGLGLSSATFTGSTFSVNTFSINKYRKSLEYSRLPISHLYNLGEFNGALYYVFWNLYNGELDRDRLNRFFPNVMKKTGLLFSFLRFLGYFEKDGSRYLLTKKGKKKLHIAEEWLTYEFIDPIWTALRKEK